MLDAFDGFEFLFRSPIYTVYYSSFRMAKKQTPSLAEAIEAVKSRYMSIRKAVEHYGVKKSTLADHVSGKVKRKKSGRDTVLQ